MLNRGHCELALALAIGLTAPTSACVTQQPESRLRDHVRELSHDSLRGREATTAESLDVARYIARELEEIGLQPGAEGGEWFHEVPFIRTSFTDVPFLAFFAGRAERPGVFGEHFLLQTVGSPDPFGRFRIERADDLDDLPTPGDDVALLFLSHQKRAVQQALGDDWRRFGLLVEADPDTEHGEPREAPAPYLEPEWEAAPDGPDLVITLGDYAKELWESGTDLLHFDSNGMQESKLDRNVVGLLPGASADLVVLSAHFDHIGVRGGQVFNGADDNASGTAVLLEVARALQGRSWERSVLFLFTGAEEKGLAGSTYWVMEHLAETQDRVVCCLNFDMLGVRGRLDEERSPWLTGFVQSTMGADLRANGVRVGSDPHGLEWLYQSSDNFTFVQEGIVGHTLTSFTAGHSHYHQPDDDYGLIDFPHLMRSFHIACRAAELLAGGKITPSPTRSIWP